MKKLLKIFFRLIKGIGYYHKPSISISIFKMLIAILTGNCKVSTTRSSGDREIILEIKKNILNDIINILYFTFILITSLLLYLILNGFLFTTKVFTSGIISAIEETEEFTKIYIGIIIWHFHNEKLFCKIERKHFK